ncbi:WGR domain-containing protein [Rhizobium wuzhouense]|uniref:WGR domain-containing protein n=1 Tax=Rhizobium wuzhouense TaxID=1986026 RepID=A0ABX5NN86_9HYPH|nr:WGR domain-containing protein [Rhizobium wuzhouense]PYB71736.1 WGR domain-containing protein [Rhizobium wuzhouense]
MTQAPFDCVHLHRIDPSINMARFYRVTIEKTLFSETVIRRSWGRIGTRGQSLSLTLPTGADAQRMAREMEHRKRRRGYREPGAS